MASWKISSIDKNIQTNRATIAHWEAVLTDGEFSARIYGTENIEKYVTDIPYESLVHDQVVAYVKAALGKTRVESVDADLAKQIAEQQAPKTSTGTPWS